MPGEGKGQDDLQKEQSNIKNLLFPGENTMSFRH